MELRQVREGDEIRCNIRGRVFDATIVEKLPGREGLRIDPPKGINYFTVKMNQVDRVVKKATTNK